MPNELWNPVSNAMPRPTMASAIPNRVPAIQVTNDAAVYMENLGYEVFRVPDHNGFNPGDPNAHYTYANAFRVNDRIFIPTYGESNASHLAREGWIDQGYVKRLLDQHMGGVSRGSILWTVLMLELWFRNRVPARRPVGQEVS